MFARRAGDEFYRWVVGLAIWDLPHAFTSYTIDRLFWFRRRIKEDHFVAFLDGIISRNGK